MNRKTGALWPQLVFFAGYVVLLVTVPRWIPPAADVFSAAAVKGYNTSIAYICVLIWSLAGMVFLARTGSGESPAIPKPDDRRGKLIWWELILVAVLFAAAFYPVFLASYAPYGEDQYFLAALHRMSCGQVPFRDFEFLYGPLMLIPIWEWMQVFGVSATSYFGMLAVVEGLTFAAILALLQIFIPDRKYRSLAFLILLPFVYNTLLGFSYNGLRKLVPVFAVFLVAYRPFSMRHQLAAAVLFALHLTYSYEYAIAGIVAATGIYALSFFVGQQARVLRALAVLAVTGLVVWALVLFLLVGGSVADYFAATFRILGVMSGGHAAFPFYWTVNSLALFGLLALFCIIVGKGLPHVRSLEISVGDRLFLAAVLYALVLLKSGLTRADLWHLIGPFLLIMFAFLAVRTGNAFRASDGQQRAMMALLVVASFTHFIGVAPTGSLYAAGYVRGALDFVSGRQGDAPVQARAPVFEAERSDPRAEYMELAEYLNAPELRDRPVLFYGRTWHMGPVIGVCKTQYPMDDLMYTERATPAAGYLEQNPDALVLMEMWAYDRLFNGNERLPAFDLSFTKKIGRYLSTIHYDYRETEWKLQNGARDRATGSYISDRYELAAEFGDVVILKPLNPASE